jgi:signal transduction histidine kinase
MSSMQRQNTAQTACANDLEQIEQGFLGQGLSVTVPARARACELADESFAGFADPREGLRSACMSFGVSLFQAHAADLAAHPDRARSLVARLCPALGVSEQALAHELLSRLDEAGRSPAETVRVLLGLLIGLTPAGGASLWRRDRAGALHCVDQAGAGACSVAARAHARRLLLGESAQAGPRAELFALCVEEQGQPVAALVARSEPRFRGVAQASARVVLAPLANAIARDALMARNASDERALVEGGERRLMRLGFDLHDGPLQELLLLGEDLRLFREQMLGVLGDGGEQAVLRGRLDDLDARLMALEGGLRRISTSLHASVRIDRPFADAIGEVVDAFATRSEVEPKLRLRGDAERISPSQRIALLSVVGEALNNVREHGAGVTDVRVEIAFDESGASARVVDDGCGFDVEAALLSAARRGRMGLAGIHERVRLLGGRCVVDSRPGGSTSVSLSLPRWEPLAAGTPARRRSDRLGQTG